MPGSGAPPPGRSSSIPWPSNRAGLSDQPWQAVYGEAAGWYAEEEGPRNSAAEGERPSCRGAPVRKGSRSVIFLLVEPLWATTGPSNTTLIGRFPFDQDFSQKAPHRYQHGTSGSEVKIHQTSRSRSPLEAVTPCLKRCLSVRHIESWNAAVNGNTSFIQKPASCLPSAWAPLDL
jgi:hypothetical protein